MPRGEVRKAVHLKRGSETRSAPAPTVFRGEVSPSQIQRRRRFAALLGGPPRPGGAVAACAPAAAETGGAGGAGGEVEEAPVISNTPFDRQGMWIWYVSHSEGGSIPAIIARAKRNGIGTVYVKSGDAGYALEPVQPRRWSRRLHAGGIDVCAWQFVYGDHPAAEARVGAISVQRGADCLVIDAEGDYEGKYAAADRYIRSLRAAIGDSYPLSLAGFPYVDYHPSFPYSVFFGPGGAQLQPAADVLEDDRHLGPHGLRAHLPLQPHLGTPDLSRSARPTKRPATRSCSSSAASPPATAACRRAGGTGRRPAGKEWSALGAASALKPVAGYRLSVEHPAAEERRPRRHGRLGAGAPDRGRRWRCR